MDAFVIGRGALGSVIQQTLGAKGVGRSDWNSIGDFSANTTLYLATKAYDVEALLQTEICKRLRANQAVKIVILSNGLGLFRNTREALKPWKKSEIVRAAVWFGAGPSGQTYGEKKIFLAPGTNQISMNFRNAGFFVEIEKEPEALEWKKAAANIVGNALLALRGERNEALARVPENRSRAQTIHTEMALVARGVGLPAPTFDECLKVYENTGPNENSMLRDLRAGRRTEIDFLNGEIVRLGTGLSIPTPANCAIVEEIRDRQK